MKHIGSKNIETERLFLRAFRVSDAEAMFQNWANDLQVTRFLEWEPHGNIETTKKLLLQWENKDQRRDHYNWAIVPFSQNEPVGGISVVGHSEVDQACVVGYCLGKDFWGQGIMTEALGAVIEFLICEVGFHRIEAQHDTNNPASGEVMKKCGMRLEGILRKAKYCPNRGFYDTAVYGVLEEDLHK